MTDSISVVAILRGWRKHVCTAAGDFVIWGHVYDDTLNRFYDGEYIHTSRVNRVEGDLVYTQNAVYRLEGDAVGPEYVSLCEA